MFIAKLTRFRRTQSPIARAMGLLLLLPLAPATGAQPVPSPDFGELVRLSATRLEISRKVALTKWDSKQPVADPPNDPREQQVIAAAGEEAKHRGLPSDLASAFFADQIEASKLVQFSLMADWHRTGKVPTEARADLKTELRPALDTLRSRFIDELLATQALRRTSDCRQRVAKDSGAYAKANGLTPLFAVSLDRGLARVCGD